MGIIPQSVERNTQCMDYYIGGIGISKKSDFIQMGDGNGTVFTVEHPIWRLEDALKNAGFDEKKDYWSESVACSSNLNFISIRQQMMKMLKTANPRNEGNQRFVFIVDRRHWINLQKKDMNFVDSSGNKQIAPSDDRIYLLKTKQFNKRKRRTEYQRVSRYYRTIPESCLSLSRDFLFPKDDGTTNYGINDMLNGYKFVLSYHVLQHDQVAAYWYIHEGGQRFELKDAEWIWPRFFTKMDGKEQKSATKEDGKDNLEEFAKERSLLDDDFSEFEKQCAMMRIKK